MATQGKITRKKAIAWAVACLEENKEVPNIVANMGEKWQVPERTAYRYAKHAQKEHLAKQEAIRKKIIEKTAREETNALNSFLYRKADKAKALLEDIEAINKEISQLQGVKVCKKTIGGQTVITTQQDVNNAKRVIAILEETKNKKYEIVARWYGYDAPNKLELSGSVSPFPIFDKENPLGIE